MEQYRLEYKAANRSRTGMPAEAGFPSACNITIHRATQLVIAEETGEGQSRSADAVTNDCELIATKAVKRYGLDPRRMLFIDRIAEATLPGSATSIY